MFPAGISVYKSHWVPGRYFNIWISEAHLEIPIEEFTEWKVVSMKEANIKYMLIGKPYCKFIRNVHGKPRGLLSLSSYQSKLPLLLILYHVALCFQVLLSAKCASTETIGSFHWKQNLWRRNTDVMPETRMCHYHHRRNCIYSPPFKIMCWSITSFLDLNGRFCHLRWKYLYNVLAKGQR